MKRLLAQYSPLFILAGLCLVFALASHSFRTTDNLRSVASRTSIVGVMALGQTLVIIAGGIDLSVASVSALAGVVACDLMVDKGWPVTAALVLGLAAGAACGAVSGLLWTRGRIPPFIATLGMMMVARGLANILTGSTPIFGLPEPFRYLGGVHGWQAPVLITLALALVFAVVLTFTRFGRAIYATGDNARAARLSGIPVGQVRVLAFVLAGAMSGFAGMLYASRVGIGDPNAAVGWELDAIAACVIGGASLTGGQGGCVSSLAGALIMNVLINFSNLKGFDPYYQQVLVGALVIFLVFYDSFRKRRAGLLPDDG